MKKIELPSGMVTLIDDDDYDRVVSLGKWHVVKGYASRYTLGKNRKRILLHRFILGVTQNPGIGTKTVVDHKNGNKLDNRKSNLRVVDRVTNLHNGIIRDRPLRVKEWHPNGQNYWRVYRGGKLLGYGKTKEEALAMR